MSVPKLSLLFALNEAKRLGIYFYLIFSKKKINFNSQYYNKHGPFTSSKSPSPFSQIKTHIYFSTTRILATVEWKYKQNHLKFSQKIKINPWSHPKTAWLSANIYNYRTQTNIVALITKRKTLHAWTQRNHEKIKTLLLINTRNGQGSDDKQIATPPTYFTYKFTKNPS